MLGTPIDAMHMHTVTYGLVIDYIRPMYVNQRRAPIDLLWKPLSLGWFRASKIFIRACQ